MKVHRFVWAFVFTISLSLSVAYAQSPIPKSNWADLDGSKLHYYDIGDKSKKNAMVFIHGWTGNVELWNASYSAFPKYRVIVVDLIGHGKSDQPQTEYTMELFARGVDAVLKKAGVSKAILIGHSMGMPVARQFYRAHPERVLGIVNVDGSIRMFAERQQLEAFIASFRSDYQKTRDAFIDGMLTAMKDEKLKDAIRTANRATPDHVGISAFSQFAKDELWKTDPIKVPVLAILAQGPFWPPDTETFHRLIAPDLEFHMWTDVTHFLMLERPKEFNETIASWIEKRKLL